MPKLIGHIKKVEEEELEDQPEGDKTAVEKEVGGSLTADKGAAAEKETGSQQMTSKDTEQIDETAKPTDKDEKAEDTGSVGKKPRSTPSITRLKDERHQAKIQEQERQWREAMEKGLGKPWLMR